MLAGLSIYGEGECFDKVTTRNFGKSKKKSDLTKAFDLSGVKFYLAFENAFHCDDYVSEKFWRNSFANQRPVRKIKAVTERISAVEFNS